MSSQDAPLSREDYELMMKRLAEANQRITQLEERIDRLEHGQDGPDARARALADHADRVRRNGEEVPLNYKEISAATGASVTTTYKDMEYWAENYDGVRKHRTASGETKLLVEPSFSPGVKQDDA